MIDILAGVLQEDISTMYFVTVPGFALRMAIDGREELSFHLERKKSRRIGPEALTHLNFPDDIALISMEINRAPRDATKGGSKCWKSGHEHRFRKT